ncbi:MAG: serine/threonine protein kinase [Planctomycetota bacterium]|nr:MAG: serine/threonine protein kinase [Planctomycetota bacterium]
MDSAFFIISEFIEGPTLAAQIQSGALSCHRAVEIVHSLALSLDKAHQQRLYHRDIKPANILLRPNGSPVITDFGLAISEAEQLGRGRSVDGTYSHMSPEQARGEVDLLDGRSDIYSLGVILFELLTGRLPFLGTSRNELLHQIIHKPALPLRTLKPTIPAKLDEICLKCLAKDPTQRYATGQDLATALQEWGQSHEKLESVESPVIVPLVEIPPSPLKNRSLPWSFRLGMAAMVLLPMFLWAIYRWPEPKPPLGPDSPRQVWLSMLKEPVDPIVQIRVEETDFLQQDTVKAILTARTEGGPWIIAASTSGVPPLRMQCKLFMDNWVGMSGLAWGISPEDRDDPTSMPRCYAVIIERFTATDPLRVSLREFHTQKNMPDQMMIGPQAILSSKEIPLPKTFPTHFEVTIDPAGVTVLIDKTQEWKPLIVEPRVMEDLKTINGRTGYILRGKTVSISDAAVKF